MWIIVGIWFVAALYAAYLWRQRAIKAEARVLELTRIDMSRVITSETMKLEELKYCYAIEGGDREQAKRMAISGLLRDVVWGYVETEDVEELRYVRASLFVGVKQ